MSKYFTLVTSNPHKVAEIERNLGTSLNHQEIDLPEIQSLDIEEVVRHKASVAYGEIGSPVLVEDSALIFHSLGELPGTYIKWFLDEIGVAGLCKMLDGFSDRSATAVACFGLFDGESMHSFVGSCYGSIADTVRDGEGFGFDYIFIPEGYDKAWSELSHKIKDHMSHRSRSLAKLKAFLSDNS